MIFEKSFHDSLKARFILPGHFTVSILFTALIANCLPARSHTNTHVVLIGMFDHCLKIKRIIKYTRSIIVAAIISFVDVFLVTMFPTGHPLI